MPQKDRVPLKGREPLRWRQRFPGTHQMQRRPGNGPDGTNSTTDLCHEFKRPVVKAMREDAGKTLRHLRRTPFANGQRPYLLHDCRRKIGPRGKSPRKSVLRL